MNVFGYICIYLASYGLGGFLIVYGIIRLGIALKKSFFSGYQETIGEIIDYERTGDFDNGDGVAQYAYKSLIQYVVNNNKYVCKPKGWSSFKPKIGTKIAIKYNPNFPEDSVKKYDFSGLVIIIGGISYILMFIILKNMAIK